MQPSDRGAGGTGRFVPVTDKMLQNPDPADWLMWRRTLDSWGYSPLDQINSNNVQQLTLAWSRTLTHGVQEGTPLVYRGVMYMPNPSDIIQAIDAKTGDLPQRWRSAGHGRGRQARRLAAARAKPAERRSQCEAPRGRHASRSMDA
ncbi:MAG TPA: hypothetical protein VES88_17605 [Gemmatimonadaceae bacterium]|nr:hypothetical protein [Gemmatimonadaceae bacterium]